MEEVGPDYCAVEWTIENFSYWNASIHNEVITSLNFFGEFHFEICPRGGRNPQERMSVRMLGDSRTEVSGDLSLIASDGYVFCSAEIEMDSQMSAFELSSAPEFEDVVSRSKMNEGLHKDQITLRFQMMGAVSNSVLNMRTAICVHEFSHRIPGETMYNICFYGLPAQSIRSIQYPSDDSKTVNIDLYAGITSHDRAIIDFNIKHPNSRKAAFICSQMSAIDKDGIVVRREASEYLCRDIQHRRVFKPIKRTEVEEKGICFLWHLRIVPENKSELLCTYNTTDQVQILPTVSLSRPTPITCVEKPSENNKADTSNQPQNAMEVLIKDFMSLYQDQKFSDITLKCENVTFPVHKNILSARSPVLDRLLSSDMKEAASGMVDIGDLDPSTLSRFLTYLYTGAVEDLLDDSALKLYYAADKYQVPSLKKECADFLCSSVSISNVCGILSLADKHSDDQLTIVAHDFILKNFNKVLSSVEWGSLVNSDSLLVAKTVTHLAQKKYVG